MSFLGRQVSYGIGKETTPGTAVAATHWINQLSFELNPMSEYVNNESAFGVIEKTNSANVMRKWAEGTFEAKLTDLTAPLVLQGAFGSVSTATNVDASGTVYDHTFNINQNVSGQSFTLVRKDAVSTQAFALARFGEWSLSMELGDYIKYSADVLAKAGSTTTATVAYSNENEFVPKNITVKTATTTGGLAGATAVATLESLTLTVNPNLEADYAAGSEVPYGFTSRGYDLSFEMTMRYEGSTYEDAFKNGTELALQVSAVNSDVTIGTSGHPGLVITAPKMNISDWSRNEDLDSPVTQTMTGTIHYSVADAYALRAVFTNTDSAM